jgi:hypothetical protein
MDLMIARDLLKNAYDDLRAARDVAKREGYRNSDLVDMGRLLDNLEALAYPEPSAADEQKVRY